MVSPYTPASYFDPLSNVLQISVSVPDILGYAAIFVSSFFFGGLLMQVMGQGGLLGHPCHEDQNLQDMEKGLVR